MLTEKYDKLVATVPQIADDALTALMAKGFVVMLVIVSHHDHAKSISRVIRDSFIEHGFGVDKVSANRVSGDEFIVIISTIHEGSGRGRSYDKAYAPSDVGLAPKQSNMIKNLKTWLLPNIMGSTFTNPWHEYG